MTVLSFESSAKAASVAIVSDGRLLGQYIQCTALTHSRTLLPMAEDLLKNTDMSFSDIDVFAVAHGPGSFTGIRIGVSTVKGLSWATDKPCIGVSTLEAMAWNGLSHRGLLCPVMDARRNQVYNALFRADHNRISRLTDDRPISLSDLSKEILHYNEPILILGDGYQITSAFFNECGIPYEIAPDNLLWQNAWGVAMAAQGKTPVRSESLLPVYLRLSQAERERQERLNL